MIVVIAGPTASGKTDLALKLAKHFDGYILNGDSRQVFKELNIGTAKPTEKEIKRSNLKHKLFGHISIDEDYNLYKYQKDAFDIIKKNKDKTAFLVGGTGLYIDSIVYNYELKESDTKVRKELENLSVEELQKRVGKNLKVLNQSDQNNPRRLIRFLEKSFEKNQKGLELKHLYLVLDIEKEVLEKRVKERVELMFEKGLLEENKALFEKGKRVDTIGYKEFDDFFEGKITLNVVKENIFINTKKYAKRQITWFKRNENAIWVKDYKEALTLCQNFLSS